MAISRRPRLAVFPDPRAVARALAQRIAAALRENPRLVLGLPTGRTSIALYEEIGALHVRGLADFSRAQTFNLDEFLGVQGSDPGSYRMFMQRHLFGRVNLPAINAHFLDGAASDPAAECERYEAAIEAAGGIDLQVLGIGTNGHIGFNEPAGELQALTHRVRLKRETRRSNAGLFGGDAERVPLEALSMGMGTILRGRAIVLIATGRSKAACIERVVNGPLTTRLPATFLQLHADSELMVDEAAAGGIRSSPNLQ